MTSALTAGWLCFGLGLAVSWFFPLGNVFFSVAFIAAVGAMCTHQVKHGLVLLISSICGIGFCAVIFFGLALGAVGFLGTSAAQKINSDLDRMRTEQQQSLQRSRTQQWKSLPLTPSPSTYRPIGVSATASTAAPMLRNAMPPQQSTNPVTTAQPSSLASDAVRNAEMQRDRINARQQRIEQLDKSITNLDHLIQQIRGNGGNESFFVKQRDELLNEKWNLQR